MKKQFGKLIAAAFLAVEVWLFVTLATSGFVPVKFLAVIGAALLALAAVVAVLTWNTEKKVRLVLGILLAVLLAFTFLMGRHYLARTVNTLENMTTVSETESTDVGIYTLVGQSEGFSERAPECDYGILKELDRENTDGAVAQFSETYNFDLKTKAYESLPSLMDALRMGEVDAIILNAAFLDLFEDLEGYETAKDELVEVSLVRVETVVPSEPEPAEETVSADQTSFTVYISGIDTRGDVSARSRSDVNILATVNTETHQVLLVSTPRDYYVPLSISNGVPDKLTHAGIYGIQVSMDTLGMVYDMDVDYYFRLNFSGFENIIDALGGVTVESDYSFNAGGYSFVKGANDLNGSQALAFARERHAFAEGDRQRGKDQMAVIKGVINKMLSPDMLLHYTDVLAATEGNFETSVPYQLISSVVNDQLANGGSWNIVSYSVDGTGDRKVPYSMSTSAYVMIPDQTTVDTAKALMQAVLNGETIQQP